MKVKEINQKIECEVFKGEDNRYHYLYQMTNLVNGMIYVGIHTTDDLEDGYVGSGTRFNNAFKKYGHKKFEKEILEFGVNRKDISILESIIVDDEFVGRKDTYNICLGGESLSTVGFKWVTNEEESFLLDAISAKRFVEDHGWRYGHNMKISEEGRERILKSQHGRVVSDKTKKKIGDANKGRFKGMSYEEIYGEKRAKEIIEKISGENNFWYGKKLPKEIRMNIAEKAKERLKNPENHGMYGKNHTEESKKKISDQAKGRFKGMTYEEMYGEEVAKRVRESRSHPFDEDHKFKIAKANAFVKDEETIYNIKYDKKSMTTKEVAEKYNYSVHVIKAIINNYGNFYKYFAYMDEEINERIRENGRVFNKGRS